jgi:hypothetical protein
MRKHLNERAAFLIITNDDCESASSLCPHYFIEKTATASHDEGNLAVDFGMVVRRRNMARGGVTITSVRDDDPTSLGARRRARLGTGNGRDSSPQSLV